MTGSKKTDGLSVLDRPNSYIGKTVPRPNLERLLQGRGLYVSDMVLPRMAHVVFLRSPYAHAKITAIDADAAKRVPGVIAVVTGKDLSEVITPWVGVLSHMKGLKSAPQHAIAVDHACWQGEAVAAIVATSRAVAEDAAELVSVDYQELDAVTDMTTALDPETPVIHASLGDNLAFERNLDAGMIGQLALQIGIERCRGENFDRDRSSQASIHRLIHHTHSASPKFGLNAVRTERFADHCGAP